MILTHGMRYQQVINPYAANNLSQYLEIEDLLYYLSVNDMHRIHIFKHDTRQNLNV